MQTLSFSQSKITSLDMSINSTAHIYPAPFLHSNAIPRLTLAAHTF